MLKNIDANRALKSEHKDTLDLVREVLREGPRGLPGVHPMWREVDEIDERDELLAVRHALQTVHANESAHYALLMNVAQARTPWVSSDELLQLGDVLDLVEAYVEELMRV